MSNLARLFRFLGSGPVAVVLIAIWAAVLTSATVYESRTTSSAVSTLVYHSWWFAALLILIAVNVTVAALRRWPWQFRHAGFLVTHLAIDILLLGALLTVAWGVDATVKIAEGSGTDRALLEGMTLQVGADQSVPLRAGSSLKLADSTTLQVSQVLEAAQKELTVRPEGSTDNPALHFVLGNEKTRVDGWLVAREKTLTRRNFGPLTASLVEVKELPKIDKSPRIVVEVQGRKATIPVDTLEDKQYPVEGTPYKIKVLQRFERAVVDGKEVTDKPTGNPNPAVRVEVEGPKGKEVHVAFARFPDFPSFHGRGQSVTGAQIRYMTGTAGGEMSFFWLPDRKVYLQYEGNYLPVRTGENLPTAFKGMKLSVDQIVDRAQVMSAYTAASDGPMAALVTAGKEQVWVATDAPASLAGQALQLAPVSFPLGFTIKLNKFTVKTDPGSTRPAAFISDVTVVDGQKTLDARIEMNQPLHYGGYSFYQSGYQNGESGPAISILQVAKDPGIGAKYVGTFLLIIGIFWAFYVEPAQGRRRTPAAGKTTVTIVAVTLLLLALTGPTVAAPADPPTSGPPVAMPSGHPPIPGGMPGSPHGDATGIPSGEMPPGHPRMPQGMPGSPDGNASGVPSGEMPSGHPAMPPGGMPGMPGGHGKMGPGGHGGKGGFHGGAPGQDPFGSKAPPVPEVNPVSLTEARRLAVQANGRVRPLDSFAREIVMSVTGRERLAGRDPVEVLLSWVTMGPMWAHQAIIYVPDQELKKALGLDPDQVRFPPSLLANNEVLRSKVQGGHGKQNLTPLEREALLTMDRVELAQAIFAGRGLAIVPPSADPSATWLAPADMSAMDDATSKLVIGFFNAFSDKDSTKFAQATKDLEAALRARGGAAYPSARAIDIELLYNRVRPFGTAWQLLVAALVLFGLGTMWGGFRMVGVVLAVASLILQTAGLGMRTFISQRAPVTNMYESVVLVAWGALAFGLVMAWRYRGQALATAAMFLSAVTLILADSVPTVLDPTIQPLTPVLRSNFWLTVHVITITLSYAAFALAMVLGHVWLVLNCLPGSHQKRDDIIRFLLANLRVGVLLLAAGTLLGGVWANYSWGRFWGWDPKEVWALIALLGYVGVLHASYTGWISDRGLSVGSIGGFLGVVMAWYGVNYILGKGLHSYGFGAGGSTWTAVYAGFEVLFVVVTVLAGGSPAAPAADATDVSAPLSSTQS